MLEVHINNITGVTIYITESKIKKSLFDTNVGLLLFLHVTPFQPSPISLLSLHLNVIGNVTIHLNVPKNYEFHTNVGRLRLFLQNITFTYDLANSTAQNNLNRMQLKREILVLESRWHNDSALSRCLEVQDSIPSLG